MTEQGKLIAQIAGAIVAGTMDGTCTEYLEPHPPEDDWDGMPWDPDKEIAAAVEIARRIVKGAKA